MGTLRLLLALSVVAAHSSTILWLPLPSGEFAVRIFFVISGFYMALILNEKYVGDGFYRLFITNRFVHIYPIYFLMAGATLILTLFVSTEIQLFNPRRLSQFGPAAMAFVFGSNLGIFGLDPFELVTLDHGSLHFTRNLDLLFAHLKLVPQAWTLSLELSFYVIAPFLVRHVSRLCAVGVASILLRLYLIRDGYTLFTWQH